MAREDRGHEFVPPGAVLRQAYPLDELRRKAGVLSFHIAPTLAAPFLASLEA